MQAFAYNVRFGPYRRHFFIARFLSVPLPSL
jgi:hypothetical protein